MKLTYGGKLERPNLCFLCETTPDHGTKVIDTERYFDGHPYNLQGRRYVCEKCINSMLVHFDLADRATVERAENAELQAQMVLRGLKQRIDVLFNDLRHLAENPTALMEDTSVRSNSETPSDGGSLRSGDAGTKGRKAKGRSPEGGKPVLAGVEAGVAGGLGQGTDSQSGASLTTSPYAQ